jgi:hypothetical protein
MSGQTQSYAERMVIYAFLAVATLLWLGIGGAVFVGILKDGAG